MDSGSGRGEGRAIHYLDFEGISDGLGDPRTWRGQGKDRVTWGGGRDGPSTPGGTWVVAVLIIGDRGGSRGLREEEEAAHSLCRAALAVGSGAWEEPSSWQ